MKKVLMGTVICLSILLLSGWCLAADTIKIGGFLPMTGAVAAYGQDANSGIQAAMGMKPTVLGKKVEYILVDTKSDKIEAANAISRLIEKDKVVAIIGEMISGNTMAGGPIAEKAKIPVVTPTSTNPLVTQGKKYVFRVCFIDPVQGDIAAKYAFSTLKAKKAALIVDKSQDYCVGLGKFFKDAFTKLGGQIVAETFCVTEDKDFSAQLSTMKPKNPDVLYAPNYYSPVALFTKQARELGLKAPVLSGDGAQADELIQIGGKEVEGVTFTGHFHAKAATTKLARDFIARWQKKYKAEPNAFHALGADAYFVLLDAISRANSTRGEAIRAALATTKNFEAISGRLSIGEDGNAVKPMVIMIVKNGKFEYLTTVNP
ncbi:MAG: ABC transporter substrate-binding protein [Thermodesulfobacteriota bacterium]|jgi:branched-chain amino acid transport system substrate-binding protein